MVVGEVADLFRVDRKTVVRWTKQGKLPYFETLGGHRRFYADEISAVLASSQVNRSSETV